MVSELNMTYSDFYTQINMSTVQALPPDLMETFICQLKMFNFIGLDFLDKSNANFVRKYGKLIAFNVVFLILSVLTSLFVIMGSIADATFVDIANALPCAIVYNQAYLLVGVVGTITFYLTSLFVNLYYILNKADGETLYRYPFNMYHVFEVNSFLRYLVVYFFQLLTCLSLHFCTHVSFILLLAAIIYDISFLLRLLQFDLEHIILKPCKETRYDLEEILNSTKTIIKRHQTILRLIENINEVFGLLLFIPLCLTSVIICFFGFMAVAIDVIWILGVLEIMLEMFNLTWPGQLLEDTSLGVAEAAYRSLWYESSIKFRKNILIILMRSQKKANLSVMGCADMNLAMFSKVLSWSWSYLSLINQLYNKKIKE